jgi:Bacterial Ig-like domain (group 3)
MPSGNGAFELQIEVGGANQINFGGGLAPTGTVTVTVGPQTLTLPLMPTTNGTGVAVAIFPSLTPANYSIYLSYSGDSNWAPATEQGEVPGTVTPPSLPASTATLTMTSPTSNSTPFMPGTLVTMSATVVGTATAAPTGDLFVMINGIFLTQLYPLTPGASGPNSIATFSFPAYEGYSGTNQVTVWYLGDSNNAGSISNTVSYTASVDDFTLGTSVATLTVATGQTANLDVLLNSYSTSTDTINIACSVTGGPSGNTVLPQCTVPASQALSGIGQVTAKLTINTVLPMTAQTNPDHRSLWPFAGGPVRAAFMLVLPGRRRLWRTFGAAS